MSDLFYDIAQNEVKEGDFCLFRSAYCIEYGMLCGKRFIDNTGCLGNFSCIYKLSDVLNPYDQERKIEVQAAYDKYYDKKETKKKVPRISAKDLEVGQAYTTINKDVYIYLGHGSLTKIHNNKNDVTETGFIYIRVGKSSFKDYNNIDITSLSIDRYLLTDMFLAQNVEDSIDVLKARKKLIAKVDYKSPIIKKNFKYEYSDEYMEYFDEENINKTIFEFKLD